MKLKFDKEKVLDKVKLVSNMAVYGGTGSLACGLVRLVVPPGVGIATQGAMLFGGWLVGQFMGSKVSEYVDNEIDGLVTMAEDVAKRTKANLDVIRDKDLKEEETTA